MSDSEDTKHFRIDMASFSPEARLPMVRHFLGPGYDVAPLEDGRFEGAADFWLLDGLTAVHNQNFSSRVVVAGEGEPSEFLRLRLRLVTHGRLSGFVNGEVVELKPGDLALDATRAALNLQFEDFSCYAIGMPVEATGHDPAIHPDILKISADDPEAAILATAIEAFFSRIADVGSDQRERMAKVIAGLIQAFIASLSGPGGKGDPRRADRLRAMRLYLEGKLSNPSLGVEDLMERFNASRAVVYRHFGQFGGVGKYLAERRLSRAMRLLTQRASEGDRIAGIAEAVGYADQRRFSRAFRRRFGITPSEARGALGGASEIPSEIEDKARKLGEHYRTIVARSEGR